MHHTVLEFAQRCLKAEHVGGARVLEVGSYDVNGSVRPVVEALGPSSYVGVDIRPGPGVDLVMSPYQMSRSLSDGAFDLVVSVEMLEHALDWRGSVNMMKAALRPGGHLLLTARSLGFPLHDFPADHWRFQPEDFARAFADFEVLELCADPHPCAPGAFLFARRPVAMIAPVDLDQVAVWSMADGKVRGSDPRALG